MKKIDEMCLNFVHLLFAKTEQEFCKYYPKHRGRGCWNQINGYKKDYLQPKKKERER